MLLLLALPGGVDKRILLVLVLFRNSGRKVLEEGVIGLEKGLSWNKIFAMEPWCTLY